MARAASSSLTAGLTAASAISYSPYFSPLPRRTMSVFWDAYFGHPCAADARLGAAHSTQLMSSWPTLNTSSTARSSTRTRVEHHFRRNAATGHEDSSLDPAANNRPSAAWTLLAAATPGKWTNWPVTHFDQLPFFIFAPRPTALWHLREIVLRSRKESTATRLGTPCTWRGPAANPADAALSIRPG